jgi:hypothetical protein
MMQVDAYQQYENILANLTTHDAPESKSNLFTGCFRRSGLALVGGCLGGLAESARVVGGRGGLAGGGVSATGWSDRCVSVAVGSLGEGQRPHVHPLCLARR